MKNYRTSVESPFRLDLKKDLAVGIVSATMIVVGEVLNLNKPNLTIIDISSPSASNIPSFDLIAIHQHDSSYEAASNVLLYSAMAFPLISFTDKFVDRRVSGHAAQVMVMYGETIGLTLGSYLMTTGLISRRRPLSYNTDSVKGRASVEIGRRTGKNLKNSFYSGHTSMAAATTFFGARVFTDFRPHSKLLPFVWGTAIAIPAFTAFSRVKSGKHFPSDVTTAYVVGAAFGYFIPQLHKIKNAENLSLFPAPGGAGIVYRF